MNYFDKTNEAMKPYAEYGNRYVLYNIDTQNHTSGLELYFDDNGDIKDLDNLINAALQTAFDELGLDKVYINVIRDNYHLFDILNRFNFVTEAIHRGQYYDGTTHDVVYMTVLKHEWQLGGIKYRFKYDIYTAETEQH